MNKVIGILAHVDSGKTTLCEEILYNTNAIRKKGRVDYKDSYFDNYKIERQRGITVYSKEGYFTYNNSKYYLVDTPGHIDFSAEMERSLNILDYAVLVISGVEKVQSHTESIYNILKENNIPTIIFVNKMDRDITLKEEIIKNIKSELSQNAFDITDEINNEFSEELIEFIAERDEELLDLYLNGNYDNNIFNKKLEEMFKSNLVLPCVFGSALYNKNIDILLEVLDKYTSTTYNIYDKFTASVYKNKYENNEKLTYIKINSGSISVKNEVYFYNSENEITKGKINEIRVYNGTKYETRKEAYGGEIVAIKGLDLCNSGDILVTEDNVEVLDNIGSNDIKIVPMLTTKAILKDNSRIQEAYANFKILEKEDPTLNVVYKESLKEISISIMGKIQIEILKEIFEERSNMEVDFGPCEILYKESIKSTTIGIGHFEPLKHYAEVVLKIQPNLRNKGISFDTKAHVDDLSTGLQNLVKHHVFEKNHKGVLGGYELTDLKITLITGKAHNKHTCGGDFREATYRALRQGIDRVESILLEPYYKYKIEVESEYMGKVISHIQRMSGDFTIDDNVDKCIIRGRGPVCKFMNYSLELISFTKGRGKINLVYDGYDECHNGELVLEERNYNKDTDNEYTSNSIFCSKGVGFTVKGEEVVKFMHCELNSKYRDILK